MVTYNEHHIKTLYSLADKVVVITGGAGFLGKAFASAVCEAGGECVLIDLSQDQLEAAQEELASLGHQVTISCLNITYATGRR